MRKVYYDSLVTRFLRKGFSTAMFFGFICTTRKKNSPLSDEAINHESIHVEQYREITAIAVLIALVMSFVFGWAAGPFVLALTLYYVIYFVEAAISWIHNFFDTGKKDAGKAADKAYRNSMFEMEAYANEGDPAYIPRRKWFAEFRYFGKI